MRSYTLTITPDDGVGAQTVVKLQVDGATPRITKLELTAAAGQTLATSQLPAINLEMLLASVQQTGTAHITSTPAPAAVAGQGPADDDTPAASPRKRPAATGGDRATQAATPKAKPGPKAKTNATGKTTASATAKKSKPATAARAYRTMPGDFAAVYQRAASVGAVADFYGVPRHTAQNWVATARRRDLIPTGGDRKKSGPAAVTGQGLFLAPVSV